MLSRFQAHLTYANVAATLALVLAMGGGAYAATRSIPGPGGVINGCYAKHGGALRLVSTGSKCSTSENAIAFNERGIRGPRGFPGQNGATKVVTRRTALSGSGQLDGTASCQAGEHVIGGGFDAQGNGSNVTALDSEPTPITGGSVPTGWHVVVENTSGSFSLSGLVFVVCARP